MKSTYLIYIFPEGGTKKKHEQNYGQNTRKIQEKYNNPSRKIQQSPMNPSTIHRPKTIKTHTFFTVFLFTNLSKHLQTDQRRSETIETT